MNENYGYQPHYLVLEELKHRFLSISGKRIIIPNTERVQYKVFTHSQELDYLESMMHELIRKPNLP